MFSFRSIFYALLMILIFAAAEAQTNYKVSYYVNLKGDTVRGYINYREWNSNPEYVEFKLTPADKNKQIITPSLVSSFTITGLETYLSFHGPISTDQTNVNRISEGRDTSFRQVNIFLKVLQTGENVNLYQYEDYIKTRYFISLGNNMPLELIFRTYKSLQDQQMHTINENVYKRQLSLLANDNNMLNSSMIAEIQHAEYNSFDITRIISHINRLNDVREKQKTRSANYLYAGIGINITPFKAGGVYAQSGGTDHTSILPKILLGYNVFTNSSTQKLAFRAELGIGVNRYSSTFKDKFSPYKDMVLQFTQISYSLTPQVLYNIYSKPKFKIYLCTGAQLAYSQYTGERFANKDGSKVDLALYPFYFNNYVNEGMFKAGVTLNNSIDMYFNYLTGGLYQKDPYFGISQKSLQLGVNLKIK